MNAIVGTSLWACAIHKRIARVAVRNSTVLITGPTGTGKELIARAIHAQSGRRDGPLVAVNCAAVPAELFAAEMFGYVKGAFTGAVCDALGQFRAAEGGTLFLDEIGDLRLDLQVKLLRAIQERAVTPLGDHRSIRVDVRIIAATNRDLSREVAAGRFRNDLYYRLNVLTLATTPLNQRPEDVAPLCRCFLKRWADDNKRPAKCLSVEAVEALMACEWPGNVRQLQNVLERVMAFSDGQEITDADVLAALEADNPPAIAARIGIGSEPRPPATPYEDRGMKDPHTSPTRAPCVAWSTRAPCLRVGLVLIDFAARVKAVTHRLLPMG